MMKILILVITVTWSFSGGYQNSPSYKIVTSPEQAAIYIYNDKPIHACDADQKKYELFEIDFASKEIKEILIPELKFEYKERKK